ncbi:MAG: TIR domain-containing protein [Desulfobacterales bacterium]|nr:TIR domain-containing protein [Desulfobacterales bacterium]
MAELEQTQIEIRLKEERNRLLEDELAFIEKRYKNSEAMIISDVIKKRKLEKELRLLQREIINLKKSLNYAEEKKKIFIGYSKKDEEWLDKLLPYLNIAKDKIEYWYEPEFGENIQKVTEEAIYSSQAAILLMTLNFFNSEHTINYVLPLIEKRYNEGKLRVFPVYVTHFSLRFLPIWLSNLRIYPNDEPISGYSDVEQTKLFADLIDIVIEFPKEQQTFGLQDDMLRLIKSIDVLYYSVLLNIASIQILIGSEVDATIYLNAPKNDNNSTHYFEVYPKDGFDNELNIFLTAPGFRFDDDNSVSMPLDSDFVENKTSLLPSQTAHFHLTALRPGPSKITADLYLGDKFLKTLETEVQIIGIDDIPTDRTHTRLQPSPVPKPDTIFQIHTQWNKDGSALVFHYFLRSFRQPVSFPEGIQYQSQPFQTKWLEQTQSLLADALGHITHASPSDTCTRLASFGNYLFNKLFPPALQKEYYNVAGFIRTLLIIADQDASYPWELLHDGKEFFGDRFIIGRWLREVDNQRPYEFPVGTINIAHYENVEHPELWASLLEPRGAPMPHMLQDGMLQELEQTESMRGLHLIRSGLPPGKYTQHDAPVHIHADHTDTNIEEKVRPAKLNLRRNRPLVTLGYISAGKPELTNLEQTWAPTFIRAGCSAFAGPLWAVNPAVEAAFVSSFYTRLWAGDSLGTAFQTARNSARTAVPDSIDWLAYVLYGDPMSRPYRPIKGQGYAAIEPIGREMDDPLPPDTPARFRVSLRRTPPVWHEARVIEVAESLEFDNLQCHVVASGIKITPEPPIDMKRTPNNDYIGWLTLTAPDNLIGETAIIQLFFEDGENPIHSLRFSIQIENPKGGNQS